MRKSKKISVGNINVGGGAPVSVQSMLNVPSDDISGNVAQAQRLEKAGCDIIRAAVPDIGAASLIKTLKENCGMPVVADIHFDYRLAVAAVKAGADAIRINPGNIGSEERVKAVADACGSAGIPIRIGVNSGSLEKSILEKYKGPTPAALVESAVYHASLLEKNGFYDIAVSIKSSDTKKMIAANKLAAEKFAYPLHLGVTEAGGGLSGIVKSSMGIGSLLMDGIGDTIRVSLTDDPVLEVEAGIAILKALNLKKGVKIISCPTCGRTRINLIPIEKELEKRLEGCKKDITVAVMGCAVNGPGEAREADIGIAGGDGAGLIFKKGVIIRKVPQDELIDSLMGEIDNMI